MKTTIALKSFLIVYYMNTNSTDYITDHVTVPL